jgi:hypothetical protein
MVKIIVMKLAEDGALERSLSGGAVLLIEQKLYYLRAIFPFQPNYLYEIGSGGLEIAAKGLR